MPAHRTSSRAVLQSSANANLRRPRERKTKSTPKPKYKRIPTRITPKPTIASPAHSLQLEAEAFRALRASGHIVRIAAKCRGQACPPYALRVPVGFGERDRRLVRDAHVGCRYCRQWVVLRGHFWRYMDRLHAHLRVCEKAKEVLVWDEDEEKDGEEKEN